MAEIKKFDLMLGAAEDRACIYETDDVQIMRVLLHPHEVLPHHRSNSNIVLLMLTGNLRISSESGETLTLKVGEACSVPFDTPMDISNADPYDTIFLVIKTPHPNKMK